MDKWIRIFFYTFMVLLFMNGCNSTKGTEDIFQYKGSFVGDNSAIANIVHQLPGGEHIEEIELNTSVEPFGIVLTYDWMESEKRYIETAINNATFIFTLVQNAGWITFHFNDYEYKLGKVELQKWYGDELREYSSEDELKKQIETFLEDESKVKLLIGA
ncbi:DUF4825 domain-containing protein [Ornithinibacillus salinisoli]|uniref:DUF4825 domain-containing protein n=1 Tax=Ornithinibacillus salinisoli TaxID=1848459 RepID=A0ABW4W4M5_9BACI